MSVVLATLCLNEMEFLQDLYDQHKDWPELEHWVFVESADIIYAETNPHMVTSRGLSTDGTTEWLGKLAKTDSRVQYIPYGFTSHKNPAQGKCQARQQYLTATDSIKPEFIFVIDADEFYTHYDQQKILDCMRSLPNHLAYCFLHRTPWRPPSIRHETRFKYEVVGGFWRTVFCRGWRWQHGLQYRNHNTLYTPGGQSLYRGLIPELRKQGQPECFHMAFTADLKSRVAKHSYYQARGEGENDRRQRYVDSRKAYETWKIGDRLPHWAKVVEYKGSKIPEVYQQKLPQSAGLVGSAPPAST